jgi:multimeric flavodoxin WrbA
MSKVLVLCYSAYCHVEAMAKAVAEGAREAGANVDIKRVPETVPEEIAKAAHFKLDQEVPIVGLDYGHAGQMTLEEITGGSPYGATTISGADGSRQPTANELQGARYQGRRIAEAANKLHG